MKNQRHPRIAPFTLEANVRETLAAADPFYRGPHRAALPSARAADDEWVAPLDPWKTAHDLGRLGPDPDAGPTPGADALSEPRED